MSRATESPGPKGEVAEAYDELLARLEKVVAELEGGGLTLEQSLEKFAQGMSLAREAQRKLDDAERRVEQLVKTADGGEATAPLEAPGGGGQ